MISQKADIKNEWQYQLKAKNTKGIREYNGIKWPSLKATKIKQRRFQ
jgi:hypothetical protein